MRRKYVEKRGKGNGAVSLIRVLEKAMEELEEDFHEEGEGEKELDLALSTVDKARKDLLNTLDIIDALEKEEEEEETE